MSWREFDLWTTGYERRMKNEWAQSTEIMAKLENLFAVQTTKPGRTIKVISGTDINPFTEREPAQAYSSLQEFKDYCTKHNIPWNPTPS